MKVLVWFRRDLRLHDNLALSAALQFINQQDNSDKVELIPLYIVHRPQIMRCGAHRFQFVLESVADLANALEARGSQLVVAKGDGLRVLRRLLPAWGITHLYFDAVCEPYAVERDNRALALAKSLGVQTHVTRGYELYNMDAVVAGNGGRAPKTYQMFLRAVAKQPKPAEPLPAPETLPAPMRTQSQLYQQVLSYWKSRLKLDKVVEEEEDPKEKTRQMEEIAGPEKNFALPELTDFGYEVPEKHSFIYGGEKKALGVLQDYFRDEEKVAKFEKPKTSPAQTPPSPATTVLSPHLFFGCLSPRTFYHQLRAILQRHKNPSTPPVSLEGQLLWREFYHCHGHANPYFDKMEESPTCLQVDWRWHTIPDEEEDMTDDDKLARSQFEAWKEGRTGFPWIDAIMIQLKEEGWMHHLARHSVACFLTRGDLYISWVRGLEVFQERLIDHDWSLNAGNWLWLSSSYFFTAYFRVYSPIAFGKKWDPEGNFIKKYIPALKKFPAKYIYEPWKAPMTLQHAAGCRIGKDYPSPIVDHKVAMGRCLEGMKRSYGNGQYGTPPIPKSPARPSKKRPRANSSEASEESTAK
ncbi:Cryptochrome-2 [Phytophthora fragariae]|uniref:Cryptochrome-2 n=1 Tax=Phytophthora fragariae TaxID=53985 RepID=A0A6A3JW87_9STRA|nr:Cryptochrome-2 [Phytophthora fragariae]KAE8931409.1 Cryptochrome-2 [Phytophthora fragariae]KAE8995943.1 Cryptochrome-2 [Phytophthora fragariae]KAE9095534.1 Cryptochrome-2 [Phytophthora fragariae]KAE9128669.1 Cryptochrome-2 [Phytophthora fragariae]